MAAGTSQAGASGADMGFDPLIGNNYQPVPPLPMAFIAPYLYAIEICAYRPAPGKYCKKTHYLSRRLIDF